MELERTTVAEYLGVIRLHHTVLRGSDRDIGYGLGRLSQDHHGIGRPHGSPLGEVRQLIQYLQDAYPGHRARVSGFAEAYGQRLEDGTFDPSMFGRAPGSAACSALHFPPEVTESGHGTICRNLDFTIPRVLRPDGPSFPFKDSYLLEMYPDGSHPSVVLLSFDLFGLPLEGINSQGLTVLHLADVDTRMDHPDLPTGRARRGFNEFLPIQFLLDTCSDTIEAEAALRRLEHYCHAVPVHLLVADRSGRAFVFEYAPDAKGKVFVHGTPGTPLKVTNFQLNRLSDPPMRSQMEARARENGFDRYRTLCEATGKARTPLSESAIREIADSALVDSIDGKSRETTLFRCVYDTNDSTVEVCLFPAEEGHESRTTKLTLTV